MGCGASDTSTWRPGIRQGVWVSYLKASPWQKCHQWVFEIHMELRNHTSLPFCRPGKTLLQEPRCLELWQGTHHDSNTNIYGGSCAGPAARSAGGARGGSRTELLLGASRWGTAPGPNESTAPWRLQSSVRQAAPGEGASPPSVGRLSKYLSLLDKDTRVHLLSTHCPAVSLGSAGLGLRTRDMHVTTFGAYAWGLYCPPGSL